MVVDICRYFIIQLIATFQTVAVAKLEIQGPIEYLQVLATTLVSLLFIYMTPIECKIKFFLILVRQYFKVAFVPYIIPSLMNKL